MMTWSAWHKGIPAAPIYNGYELATRHDPNNPRAFFHRWERLPHEDELLRIVRNPGLPCIIPRAGPTRKGEDA
jgi:hypothetical protein